MKRIVMALIVLVIVLGAVAQQPQFATASYMLPAGTCPTLTAPSGINSQSYLYTCADLTGGGTLYVAPTGGKYVPLVTSVSAKGNNCTSFKINVVNADGSWNVSCLSSWQ